MCWWCSLDGSEGRSGGLGLSAQLELETHSELGMGRGIPSQNSSCPDSQLEPTAASNRGSKLGLTRELKFVSTALQNLQLALCRMCGQWPGTEPQQGDGSRGWKV